jgi:hypothetical protein
MRKFHVKGPVSLTVYDCNLRISVIRLSVCTSLAHKHLTRLERLAKDRHTDLLWKSVNYGRKMFMQQAHMSIIDLQAVAEFSANFKTLKSRYCLAFHSCKFRTKKLDWAYTLFVLCTTVFSLLYKLVNLQL